MSLLEFARHYVGLGWQLVPVPHRSKRPVLEGWQRLRLSADELSARLREPGNVGVILGAVSGGLVDVDLDCAEAVQLAPLVLAPTWTYGRPSKPRSHWLYTVPGGADFRKYVDRAGGQPVTMLELRSSRDEGRLQSVLPPSTHEGGEAIRWSEDADASEAPRVMDAEHLCGLVDKLAVATLYARHGHMLDAIAWLTGGAPPRVEVGLLLEANRLRGIVPSRETARAVTRRLDVARSETLDAAVEQYNAAHRYEWPRAGGTCPMCGHRECFGTLPQAAGRWACFSAGHPETLGVRGETCMHGDALDVDAHRAGVSRVELLRREGYL